MPKPVDKFDSMSQYEFQRLDQYNAPDDTYKREHKRLWKKLRKRHLRNKQKEELRERLEN